MFHNDMRAYYLFHLNGESTLNVKVVQYIFQYDNRRILLIFCFKPSCTQPIYWYMLYCLQIYGLCWFSKWRQKCEVSWWFNVCECPRFHTFYPGNTSIYFLNSCKIYLFNNKVFHLTVSVMSSLHFCYLTLTNSFS